MRGLVEVVEAPQIDGVHTLGTHRVLQTTVDGKPRTGELYNYVASFGTFLVIVTANPLVLPDKPVAPVEHAARPRPAHRGGRGGEGLSVSARRAGGTGC